jgi:integrase/recombinase XerD
MSSDAISGYLDRIDSRRAENTVKNRRVALRQFFEWLEGTDIDDLSTYEPTQLHIETYHLEDFIDYLRNQDYANRSIQDKIYSISSFCQYCEKRHLGEIDVDVSETVAEELTGNKIDEYVQERYLEIDEFKQMLDSTDKMRNKILLKLMWDTGVRASEAVSIKVDDINRDENQIEVENAKTKEISETTTRNVYYSKRFDLLLTKWLSKGYRSGYMYTDTEDDEEHLLVTKQQPRMAVGRVNEIVKEVAEKAGIQLLDDNLYKDAIGRDRKKITSHALRHSFAVHRVKNGCPIIYLQRMLGHSDIEQTRKYLKFRDDDVKEAYQKYSP